MNSLFRFILTSQGLLRYQDFTSSGTFTPSARLLTNGGNCFVILFGAGGGASWRNSSSGGAIGGDAGQMRCEILTVSAGTTVTLGAGGAGATTAGNAGSAGGNSTFGGLLTALGGRGGDAVTDNIKGRGGNGVLNQGSIHSYPQGSQTLDARGGKGWSGRGGGGGGTVSYGDFHMRADDGAGSGSLTVTNDAAANSGAGGGGFGGASGRAGNGGSGWCRVVWFE